MILLFVTWGTTYSPLWLYKILCIEKIYKMSHFKKMKTSNEAILKLQEEATEIICANKIPHDFRKHLVEISEKLLSISKENPNSFEITEEFQGLIYCLCKLAVCPPGTIDYETYYLIFRTIIALSIYFFSISKSHF